MSKKTIIAIAIIVILIIIIVGAIFLFGKEINIEGTLEEIMTKVYAGISEEELPMMLGNIELTSENIENYVGTSDIDFKEAIASESAVGSIAHSVVLIRLNDASKANETVTKIEENANPGKWICVVADDVIVKSKGDLVILIMSNEELAPRLDANFEGLE